MIRCNQTIRAVIGAAESKHAASTPHGVLGPAESCGESAAIMVGGACLGTSVEACGLSMPRAERM